MAVELKTDADRLAYALALNFATSIRQLPVPVELSLLGDAVAELLHGAEVKMSHTEYGEQMRKLQQLLHISRHGKALKHQVLLPAQKGTQKQKKL